MLIDLFKERWHVVVVEGERPTQQGIEDDPAAPDIDLWTSIQPEDVGNNKQSWSYEGHTLLDWVYSENILQQHKR